jgi:uncharacterized protein (TIGR02001 family)
MKKTILALSLAALSVPVLAQDKKPEPEYTITGNVGVFSDYRFRGISQTRRGPAIQGGFDIAHKSGFYLGNWNSNVSAEQYYHGAGIEMDFYGGFKTELLGVGLDLGAIRYDYPSARIQDGTTKKGNFNNNEIYLGLSYGPISLKTFYATTNYFGLNSTTDDVLLSSYTSAQRTSGGSKGTMYYDLTFSKEIVEKVTLVAHYGMTEYKNYSKLDYKDYKIGVNYDIAGWIFGVTYIGNSGMSALAKSGFYSSTGTSGDSLEKKLYRSAAVLSLSKTF